jgi:hypothetical protein
MILLLNSYQSMASGNRRVKSSLPAGRGKSLPRGPSRQADTLTLLACFAPAWKAARVDPSSALRYE